MSSPMQRGRRRAELRKELAREVFAKQLTDGVDVETLLLDKLMQRSKGGSNGILQQFRKIDMSVGDGEEAEISFENFKECLAKFGLDGLREEDARKLFNKYDTDGSGGISLQEFANNVIKATQINSNIGRSNTDIQDAKRARERARIMKQTAMRTGWKTVSVDAERLLQQKIEERIKGGPNSLRLAFRKFCSDRRGDSAISFEEFGSTLARMGLEGLSEDDLRVLFDRFDDDKNGTIEYSEFVEFVLKSNARHNGLAVAHMAADKQAQRLRQKALEKQKRLSKLHWDYAADHVDIETMVVDKVQQKLKSGPHALRRAFGLFDQEHGDAAEISRDAFRMGLEELGFVDIPPRIVKRLFAKYDTSGDGIISFSEFIAQMEHPTRVGERAALNCCKHCCSYAYVEFGSALALVKSISTPESGKRLVMSVGTKNAKVPEFAPFFENGSLTEGEVDASRIEKENIPLAAGLKYHVFISHRQVDAGDACNLMAEKLRNRGLKVWVDQETEGNLAEDAMRCGIRESKCYLLFLSKTVFKGAVKMELETALQEEKPILLVHECDPARIGFANFSKYINDAPASAKHIFLEQESMPFQRRLYLAMGFYEELVSRVKNA
ncbi:Ras and EF-hand domain-containing protein [Hondaea fermentalgiana]|uniref:Ras and EF-hand domain-containing protein n=1 Tax=Hondaea fermentalgiana TaxID=2315210 RepID=A0A2R5GZJ7_9STRA|nr:Ras and EF-hand domain-containing protein [Hondaea fermentalgiana]|eukprot:GBG34193.1 Ras and EF-hand domain-containing protein [Hondaea fermentalgiana]